MPNYRNSTSSGVITANPVTLHGVFISSVTAGTIAIFDDVTASATSNTVIAAFTPNTTVCWYPFTPGVQLRNGLNVSISGTVTYTAVFS